jgi:hypothetical protein
MANAANETAGLSKQWCGLPNTSQGAHCLPYSTWCHRKAKKIIKDLSHPSHGLLPCYHPEGEVSTGASKLGQRPKLFFSLKATRLLNSHH